MRTAEEWIKPLTIRACDADWVRAIQADALRHALTFVTGYWQQSEVKKQLEAEAAKLEAK